MCILRVDSDCTFVYTVYTVYGVDFILSQTDGRPMYLQIMDQVQQRVGVGDWPPGTKLPSIRELAVSLNVSVITVKRAYLELERNGVIVTQHGKGSWIAEGFNRDRMQQEELERHLTRATALAAAMGIPPEELTAMLEEYTDNQGGTYE